MTGRVISVYQSGDDCGCATSKKVGAGCNEVGYSDCPHTLDPMPLKSTRRFCFNFGKDDCEDCSGCSKLYYEQIRMIKIENVNPPCVESQGGVVRITSEHIDPDTGKFRFSVDTNDQLLVMGERFLITVWARTPDTEEHSISAYVSIK